MHEVAIAQNLIAIVQNELKNRKIAASVERVVVKAGKLNAIIPDSLSFHFDLLKEADPQLKTCALVVEEVPVLASCPTCRREVELQNPLFLCETCGTPLSPSSDGKDLYIDHIEVQD